MRTYVITGAASGIGRATTELLREQGHRVIGVDIHDADVTVDLTSPLGREQLVTQVAALSGGVVDAVVANAGLATATAATIAVNYYGALATLEGLRPMLARSSAPRAVATASMASLMPVDEQLEELLLEGTEADAMELAAKLEEADDQALYSTSKRALVKWIRRNAAAAGWAGAGIPLNAVAPGIILTPMVAPLMGTPEATEQLAAMVPMPLNGFAEPLVVAKLIAFLAGEDNSHLCGQVVFVDGGSDAVIRGDSAF